MENEFIKDPAAVLDYTFDWSDWLNTGETISSHTVTVPTGITLGSHANDTTAVTMWLSGGAVGEHYAIACQITTSQGRTDKRRILIMMEER